MNSKAFAAQYKDARWQRKRLEIMERDKFTCHMCRKTADDGITLNVHHSRYIKGKKPWEYEKWLLTTLCEDCHRHQHGCKELILEAIAKMGKREIEGLVNMIHCSSLPKSLSEMSKNGCIPDDALALSIRSIRRSYSHGREDAA